jgi:hypothetical protein
VRIKWRLMRELGGEVGDINNFFFQPPFFFFFLFSLIKMKIIFCFLLALLALVYAQDEDGEVCIQRIIPW